MLNSAALTEKFPWLRNNPGPFSGGDLVLENGQPYHVRLPAFVGEKPVVNMIFVGAPERQERIVEKRRLQVFASNSNRDLNAVWAKDPETGLEVGVFTTHMGVGSTAIVVDEAIFLTEMDFTTQRRRERFPQIRAVRIGTCGFGQLETAPGSGIITTATFGLDVGGHMIKRPDRTPEENVLFEAFWATVRNQIAPWVDRRDVFYPYMNSTSQQLNDALKQSANEAGFPIAVGIGVTCPGFYDEQWRPVSRFQACLPDLDKALFAMKAVAPFGKIEAIEMENAVLASKLCGQGHLFTSFCNAIGDRRNNRFATNHAANTDRMIDITFQALAALPTD
ncbi:Uridine phosphorylase [Singulisphaera sp. GP187]|uniref:phosphorylase family protein n=1 Tax=Singulisphaera sp. GP187 TaxID=1882752 RepID=UPI0009266166|nr:hypothetical protein [Singulisphaera sp. GP187]SIO35579.1 Uridine phosphorylase [Singulisphaera sp. GP187]